MISNYFTDEFFDGEKFAGFTWFRSNSNFSDINDAGVTAWDDSQDGYKFVGGYAYGLWCQQSWQYGADKG